MSGSRDQSNRNIIEDIRETLRLYLKGLQCTAVETRLDAYCIEYPLSQPEEIFGGVLVVDNPSIAKVPVGMTIRHQGMSLGIASTYHRITPLTQGCRNFGESFTTVQDVPVAMLPLIPGQVQVGKCQAQLSPTGSVHAVTASQFALRGARKLSARIQVPKILKPRTYVIRRIYSKLCHFPLYQKTLPIYRKPIPPHRFSKESRALFRERLAEKYKIPEHDVQILQIYDRLFLEMYQSLSPMEDGTLTCLPKSLHQIQTATKSIANAVYLVMGQSIKKPGTPIQVVIPMTELTP